MQMDVPKKMIGNSFNSVFLSFLISFLELKDYRLGVASLYIILSSVYFFMYPTNLTAQSQIDVFCTLLSLLASPRGEKKKERERIFILPAAFIYNFCCFILGHKIHLFTIFDVWGTLIVV